MLRVDVSLDLGYHVVIGVGRLTVQQDVFLRQLHFTTHTQFQVQSYFLLDVVVRLCPVIVNSNCIPNSGMFDIAKAGPLRCCLCIICGIASHHLCNFDDVLGLLTSFGNSSNCRFAAVEPSSQKVHSRRLQNGITVLVYQDCTDIILRIVCWSVFQSKLERIRLGIARHRSLICALLFNDCGSYLQLFQLLSYFQTSGSNEIRSLFSIVLRSDRLLCPCAFVTAFRALLLCFICPPRTGATLPPLLLRPPAVRSLCTASIPTLLGRPPSHFKKRNQQRHVFVGPRTQRNKLATRAKMA